MCIEVYMKMIVFEIFCIRFNKSTINFWVFLAEAKSPSLGISILVFI